jgi:hypothetical protein
VQQAIVRAPGGVGQLAEEVGTAVAQSAEHLLLEI